MKREELDLHPYGCRCGLCRSVERDPLTAACSLAGHMTMAVADLAEAIPGRLGRKLRPHLMAMRSDLGNLTDYFDRRAASVEDAYVNLVRVPRAWHQGADGEAHPSLPKEEAAWYTVRLHASGRISWRPSSKEGQEDDDPMSDLPDAAGPMTITLIEFERRARVLMADEQAKPSPDTRLIGLLCEAVRLKREHVETLRGGNL